MFEHTIQQLKGAGLIIGEDIVVMCTEAPSQAAFFWGGAIGGAIASAKARGYIMSANQQEIRIFDIDKKTGEYLGTFALIQRNEIKKAFVSTMFGSGGITIKTFNETHKFQIKKKIHGFIQGDAIKQLKEFFKGLK